MCYVTEIGQVRRVLEAKDGKIKYESGGERPAADRGGPGTSSERWSATTCPTHHPARVTR